MKYDEEMLNYHQVKVSWNNVESFNNNFTGEVGHDNLRNWQANQPIYQDNVSWKDLIPEENWEEVFEFFDKFGEEIMTELGYKC